MPIYVPGCGNGSAKLMIVGEAPGYYEELALEPFVGPSGAVVNEVLGKAGVDRSEVYLTNVVKIRPPENEIYRLPELGTKIEDFLPQLWAEIDAIKPNCILAFGNTALKALTGEVGIQKFRGSILHNVRTGLPKVVATIHPASLMHAEDGKMKSYRDKAFIQFDVNRAVQQSLTREWRPPDRLLSVCKSSMDLLRFISRHTGNGKRIIAYDIETFKAIPMCIGFAFSRHEAISVPLFDILGPQNPEGIPLHDMQYIWKIVADLLLDPQYKLVGHNLKFDQGRLLPLGFETTWPYFDTQLGWHALYSELPKKLAFVSSILTEEPYYKDDLEEYNPKKEKLHKRLIYNARDCCVEYEVFEKEYAEMEQLDMLDWFFETQMPLHKFYFNMERRGILVDKAINKRLDKKYDRYIRWIDRSLEKDLGYILNVNSPKQVTACLYGDLRCPVRKDTAEETLEMLMLNAVKDERRRRIINNVLKGRKARKTRSTYIRAKLSADGRGRTVVNITGTESGRTSTSKPKAPVVAEPEGYAFQTLTKHGDVGSDLRLQFIPGYVENLQRKKLIFFEADLSQAEARVVAHLANDDEAMAMMNKVKFIRNKFGIKDDIHTWTTQLVLGAAFESIDDELRQLGKKTRHAGNYGMGKRRLSLMAQISEWRAGKCLEKFHDTNPKISGVFWVEVKQALEDNDMVLYTPQLRRRMFFDKWGDDMFKEAYAHIPQGTVSDHLKAAAIRIESRCPWLQRIDMGMVQESHDSFLATMPEDPGLIKATAEITKEELEKPIDFARCSIPRGLLVIPCEMQYGDKNWKEMKKVA